MMGDLLLKAFLAGRRRWRVARVNAFIRRMNQPSTRGQIMVTASRDKPHDLFVKDELLAARRRRGVKTMGARCEVLISAPRTMDRHTTPYKNGALIVADDLINAQSGVGTVWDLTTPGDHLCASIVLLGLSAESALRQVSRGIREAIEVHSHLIVDEGLREDSLVMELFAPSDLKIAGVLAEPIGGGAIVGFDINLHERGAHELPVGRTSVWMETGLDIPRLALLVEMLATIEFTALVKEH
jgi:hypothetical protein